MQVMQTSMRGIANKAKENPEHRFQNLIGLLNEANLKWCMQFQKKKAAPGVDKVDYAEYNRNLDENVKDLVGRLKRGAYKAKLVRRRYIPKGNGKTRPLGIPVTEDKLLQTAVKQILQAIYEEDFLECSYGYRPKVSALDAVKDLKRRLQFGGFGYVVEADIKGFFDNIDHEKLIAMLEKRVDDKRLLRLIRKWLKAGVLEEDGRVIDPVTGTPQGGVISAILANIYLHHALDEWFEENAKKISPRRAKLIRYADDFVAMFQYKKDAEGFYRSLSIRLRKYGLEVAPEKTQMMRFSNFHKEDNSKFDFLGFEFRWGTDRKGKDRVQTRTSRKKLRKSIESFTEWIKKSRNSKVKTIIRKVNRKLRGYWNYYGLIGNYESLRDHYRQVRGLLYKWLNRRSQRRSYKSWECFNAMASELGLLRPRITEEAIPLNLLKYGY